MNNEPTSYPVTYNLEDLKKRLEIGMQVKGRILECPKKNRYILRIRGYNIYTESNKKFDRNDEILLTVKKISPNLVLDMKKAGHYVDPDNNQADIII
ncbi:MAG: hypothetical protein ACLFQM_06090 [Fidelibacterota bacterium]